ncbi:MAG: hypothetical protein EXR04_07670 [Rhodospirillales bacterium]|nr:hypothetical protein [Rhodospirillales bacterium]
MSKKDILAAAGESAARAKPPPTPILDSEAPIARRPTAATNAMQNFAARSRASAPKCLRPRTIRVATRTQTTRTRTIAAKRVDTPRATPRARAKFDSARRLATKMIEKLFKLLFIGGVERFAIGSAHAVDRVK